MKFKFIVLVLVVTLWGFRGSSAGKKSACSSGDPGSIPGSGRFPWRRDRLPTPVFLEFPGGSDGKGSTCNVKDLNSIPGLRRSSGGGHGNPFQSLAWRIPWTEEPGGLQSTRSQRVGHD